MDLDRLREIGGFVPPTPVTETVSWTRPGPDGQDVTDTFTVRIKKHSAGSMERLWAQARKAPDRCHVSQIISETVLLGDEGDAHLTYQQAYDLDYGLASVLVEAIDKVNPLKRGTPAKN